MGWIDFRVQKPEMGIVALVYNVKGFMVHGSCVAIYHHKYDVWQQVNPEIREHPPLEVTHYFPLPDPPPLV